MVISPGDNINVIVEYSYCDKCAISAISFQIKLQLILKTIS